jgi:hypothetical protein
LKRAKYILAAFALAFSVPTFGADVRIGTIVATTTKNNSDTAAPFDIPRNTRLVVQCDVETYITWGTATTAAATAASGLKLAADEKWETNSTAANIYLAALPVSAGTANCKVFKVL